MKTTASGGPVSFGLSRFKVKVISAKDITPEMAEQMRRSAEESKAARLKDLAGQPKPKDVSFDLTPRKVSLL